MPKHNVNDFDQLFRRTITQKADDADPYYLKLDRVNARQLRVLTHVTVENKTDGYTKCRLGIDHSGVLHYLDELTTPLVNELAVSRTDIILGEGDVFFSELAGGIENDTVIMTCIGWEQTL